MNIVMKNCWDKFKKIISCSDELLFFGTLLFHIVIIILFQTGTIPIPGDFADQTTYHEHATAIARLIRSGSYTFGAVYPHHWYPLFLGVVYSFVGSHMVWGMVVNAFVIACSAILVFKIALQLGARSVVAWWTAAIVTNGYASLVYTSSLLLKEAWIVLLVLIMTYTAIRMVRLRTFSVSLFLAIITTFVALRSLRFFVALGIIAGFFAVWFICSRLVLRKRIIAGISMFICITGVSYWLTGEQFLQTVSLFDYLHPKAVHELREDYYKGGSTTTNIGVVQVATVPISSQQTTVIEPSGSSNIVESETAEVVTQYRFSAQGLFVSAVTMVAGPFPWQLSLQKYIVALPDLIVWYLALALASIAVVSRFSKEMLVIIIPVVIMVGGLIVGVDNIGALLRYRIPVVVLLAILAPIGVEPILDAIRKLLQRSRHENSVYHN